MVFILSIDPRTDLNGAIVSKLDGVREEVHANLLHSLLVSKNSHLGCRNLNFNILAGRLHIKNAYNFCYSMVDVKFFKFFLKNSSFNLRVVKCIVHVVKHQDRRKLYDLKLLAPRIIFLCTQQEIRETDGCTQRRTHFVGYICRMHARE